MRRRSASEGRRSRHRRPGSSGPTTSIRPTRELIARLVPPTPTPYPPAQPADQGGHRDRRVDRRVRARRLRRADRDHRVVMVVLAVARPACAGRLVRVVVPADAADRDLGRPRQRLHPGRDDRPVRDRPVRRDRSRASTSPAQTLVRLFAISLSIGLFVLTTEPRAFVFDLERRGVSPRFAFVARRDDRGRAGARRAGRASSARASGPAASTPRAASAPGSAASCRSSVR